jgi:hypothetical protein
LQLIKLNESNLLNVKHLEHDVQKILECEKKFKLNWNASKCFAIVSIGCIAHTKLKVRNGGSLGKRLFVPLSFAWLDCQQEPKNNALHRTKYPSQSFWHTVQALDDAAYSKLKVLLCTIECAYHQIHNA